jgi:ESCRT-I complex subunit TSG101
MLASQRLALPPPQLEGAFQRFGNQQMRLRQDIYSLIQCIPTLFPAQDTFVTNEGKSYLMLLLDGTLPISFHGAIYQIPINIWISDQYPVGPPLCYVVPTPGMMLCPGHPCVDASGLVDDRLPYIRQWRADTSNLIGLAYALQNAFSIKPPVFAKPPESPTGHLPTSHNGLQASYNSPPTHHQMNSSLHSPPPQPKPSYPTTIIQSPQEKRKDKRKQLEDLLGGKLIQLDTELNRDMEKFTQTQKGLEQNETLCQRAIESLQNEERELDKNLEILHQADEKAAQWLQENESKKFNVDDVIVPDDVLSQQMFDLVAEDAAIEDTLYYLNRALESGVIDVDSFLKAYRSLSREQFLKRALCTKVFEAQHQKPLYTMLVSEIVL